MSLTLAISIVSWNTCDLLRTCLQSLLRHCDLERVKIIVVDNESSDGTPRMVRREFHEVTLLESGGNLGFGKAHNLIANHSSEPFVLFLNPDCELVDNAPEQMLRIFTHHPDVGLVGCRMTNGDGIVQPLGFQCHATPWNELIISLFASRRTMPLAGLILPSQDPLQDGYVRKLYGGCLMAKREILDRVGWFDERFFMYGEDVDLCRKVEAAGWRLYYLSQAKVLHLTGAASAKAPGGFATLMQCESIAKLMRKYYGPLGQSFYGLVVLGRAFSRLVLAAIVMVLFWLKGDSSQNNHLRYFLRKNLAMLRWGLGLERPHIPL